MVHANLMAGRCDCWHRCGLVSTIHNIYEAVRS